jgi:SAM-dependent methyltransferase
MTTASNVSHTLTAVARDALGVRYTSDPVAVTVSSAAPAPAATRLEGFPAELLPLLRCPKDQQPLGLEQPEWAERSVISGRLKCAGCGRNYSISNGIAILLETQDLDPEGQREQRIRDEGNREDFQQEAARHEWVESDTDWMEMLPTLGAMATARGQVVLEFGCGSGRYTLPLAKTGAFLLALDFSMGSLRALAQRLPAGLTVGLVQADATRRCVAPRCFDRILSTLVSNLPSREHRLAMLRVAAEALKDTGHFVFSTHHQNLTNRLLGRPPSGRYSEGGIFRYYMRRDEILRESGVYFRRIACRPIQIFVPFTRWTGISTVTMSRLAEWIPLLRQKGDLLVAKVAEPIRIPEEGEGARPNRVFSAIYVATGRIP